MVVSGKARVSIAGRSYPLGEAACTIDGNVLGLVPRFRVSIASEVNQSLVDCGGLFDPDEWRACEFEAVTGQRVFLHFIPRRSDAGGSGMTLVGPSGVEVWQVMAGLVHLAGGSPRGMGGR